MKTVSRRNFGKEMLSSFFTVALIDTLNRHQALAATLRPIAKHWLAEVEELSRGMREHTVKQVEWQQQIESLFARVERIDLLRAIDFDRLSKTISFPNDHEGIVSTEPRTSGLPRELSFQTFIYGLNRGRAIVPHCHRNMTSMHMVIGGDLHGWHFDRVADEPGHVIIKPTMDKPLVLGEVSTTSDDKDNVHWFKATSAAAFTFNIGVYEINSADHFSGRQFYLDAAKGEKLSDGTLRVRHLKMPEAYRLYGKS